MAETHKVTINNMAFNPARITISNGDTVEWTNQMAVDHTVTPDNNEFPSSGHKAPSQVFLYLQRHRFGRIPLPNPSVHEGCRYRHLIRIRGFAGRAEAALRW
jgi:hypothetical protein